MGYTRISSREWKNPTTGELHLLTKPSRFGAEVKPGKSEEAESARFNPIDLAGGVIISK